MSMLSRRNEERRNELTNTGKYDTPTYYDEQGTPRTITGERVIDYEKRLDNLYSTIVQINMIHLVQ